MFNIPYLTSCNHCREKKRKCNQERPACSLCRAHNVPCEYRRSRRFRKRTQDIASAPPHGDMSAHNFILKQEQRPNGQRQQQDNIGMPGSHTQMPPLLASYPVNGSHASASASAASGSIFPSSYSHVAGVTMQQQQQLPDALPNEVNALTKLLASDLYSQTQQLPQPILQGVNTFMSPFSDMRSNTIPDWISQQKPEAAIISNLENIASAYQASPLVPLQTTMTPDGGIFGNLASQLMQGGSLFQSHPFSVGVQQQLPPQSLQLSQAGVSQDASGALAIPSILTPPVTAGISAATGAGYNGLTFTQQPPFGNGVGFPSVNKRPSSLAGGNPDGEASWASSPVSGQSMRTSLYEDRSASAGVKSGNSTPMPNMLSTLAEPDKREYSNDSIDVANSKNSSRPSQINGDGQSQEQRRTKPPVVQYPEDYVPEVIQVYAKEFPADLAPEVLLKVMRGICGSTRTSLINVDLDLLWCMILKGIIPRILLFAYIASMARGQVIDPELMPLLPAKFDELCYDVATRDIELAAASPCLWSALSLHLIGRYEFQSARYDLMMEHYEMASDILTKTTFHGCAFPWKNVPEELKHTFEYDYYVYTFWVGFQWHLVSSFNLDRPFNVNMDPHSLPIPTSTRGYFAPDLPCEFDLLTLLPANSWPRSKQTRDLTQVWFRGFDDPEYEGWRPSAWKNIRPNYKITVYLQRMMPLGAQLYCLQRNFSDGKLELGDYLRQLHTHQELLKQWLYSLPEEFEITLAKVTQFAKDGSSQEMPGENKNLLMDFKELIMTYALYSTFVIRANRVALLKMLNENISTPATSMGMRLFELRDYFEALNQGGEDCDFGHDEFSPWQKNLDFHKCRMQCYESMDILCDVVQLSFILRLDLFTYGTTYVTIAGEMLNVLISQLGVDDRQVKWRTKTRLGHVLCLLRSLQYWAPALYMFVYGIQALSDPSLVLDVDNTDASLGTADMEKQASGSSASSGSSDQVPLAAHVDLGQQSGKGQESEVASEMANPFPRNHIINLIVADLDVSLAAFLAPAYPVLLLKIFASKM